MAHHVKLRRRCPLLGDRPIQPGDFYLDCAYHPVLCTYADDEGVEGISLVDGSWPRSCSRVHCSPLVMTAKQAIEWRLKGPRKDDIWLPDNVRETWGPPWWEREPPPKQTSRKDRHE